MNDRAGGVAVAYRGGGQCFGSGGADMSFGVCRAIKLKGGSAAAGVQIHNRREREHSNTNPDIDFSRSHLNYTLVDTPGKSYNALANERIKEGYTGAKAIRKDAVKIVEMVFTSDGDFFKGKTLQEQRLWFETCLKWARDSFGADNIIAATVHMDERTPHLHVDFVPLTPDGRLSAKDLLGGPVNMQHMQDSFYDVCGKPWGLERGERADFENPDALKPRKHLSTPDYKRVMEAKVRDLEERKEKGERLVRELRKEYRELDARLPELRQTVAGLSVKEQDLRQTVVELFGQEHICRLQVDELIGELAAKREELTEIQGEFAELQDLVGNEKLILDDFLSQSNAAGIKLQDFESDLEEIQNEIKAAQREREEAEAAVQAARQNVENIVQKYNEKIEEVNGKLKTVYDTEKWHADRVKEIDDIKAYLIKKKPFSQDYEMSGAQSGLKAIKDAAIGFDSLRREYNDLVSKYNKLTAEHADLQKQVPSLMERAEQDWLKNRFSKLPVEIQKQLLDKAERSGHSGFGIGRGRDDGER